MLPGVRARSQRPRAEQQVAGAAARAHRAPDHPPRPRREDPAVSLRAVDSGATGPSCTRCSRSPARADRAAADRRAGRRRADDDRAGVPARAAAAADERRQPDGAARRMGRRAARRVVRAAAPERSSRRRRPSFYVDLGARSGLSAARPGPLEGRVLFLDTRPLHAMLMQNVVMLEQKVRERAAVRPDAAPHRAAQPDDQARRAGRSRSSSRSRGAASASARRAASTRSSASPRSPAILRDEERASAGRQRHRTGKSFDDTMELAVFGRMRNENDAARRKSRGGCSRPTRRPAGLGDDATYRRPASGWSRR